MNVMLNIIGFIGIIGYLYSELESVLEKFILFSYFLL